MTKSNISQYDATASNNTDIDGTDIAENCSPAGINNAIRSLMSHLKQMDVGTVALTSPEVSGDLTIADKIVHSGDANTAIRFADTDTITLETAGGERVRVDSSGRVGVGISPDTALHVAGSGVPFEVNSTNSNALKQEFSDNGTTRGFIGASSANAFMVGIAQEALCLM